MHLLNKNFSLILEMFMFIGIYFPHKTSSGIKKVCAKLITIILNLFSVYYFFLLCFHGFNLSFGFHFIMDALQFTSATCIRLYLSWNATKIAKNCNILLNKMPSLSRRNQKTCRIFIIVGLATTFLTFSFVQSFLYFDKYAGNYDRKYMLFDYTPLQISLIVFADFLIALRNCMLSIVPHMAIILLSFVYYELGNLVHELKMETKNTMNMQFSDDLLLVKGYCCSLSKTMHIVQQVDCVLTMPMFYLLSFLLTQIMIIVSLVTLDPKNILITAFSLFLGCGVCTSLLFIAGLASRIPGNFSGLKNIILTSSAVQEKMMSGKNEAISYVGLIQMFDKCTENFHVTAMGCLKIEKSVILCMLCAFVSYSVILNQMIPKD